MKKSNGKGKRKKEPRLLSESTTDRVSAPNIIELWLTELLQLEKNKKSS